jgi:hypothetical protein
VTSCHTAQLVQVLAPQSPQAINEGVKIFFSFKPHMRLKKKARAKAVGVHPRKAETPCKIFPLSRIHP